MIYVFNNACDVKINIKTTQDFNSGADELEEYLTDMFCKKLKQEIKFCYLSFDNYVDVVKQVTDKDMVFNLCDGMDLDGYLGLSLIKELEKQNKKFTGAKALFYEISTFKSKTKEYFIKNNVSTARYYTVNLNEDIIEQIKNIDRFPLFVKPDNYYAGAGLDKNSIIRDLVSLRKQLEKLKENGFIEIIIEEYIDGEEYTVLVSDEMVYPPAQRVFNDLPYVLYGDNLCDNYNVKILKEDEERTKMICDIAKRAYDAIYGNSYGRVDIRVMNGIPYVLEVNANPGIGPDTSSLKILRGYEKQWRATHEETRIEETPEVKFYKNILKL